MGAKSVQMLREAITETFISFSTDKKLGLATSARADNFYKAVCKELLIKLTIEKVKHDTEVYMKGQEQAQEKAHRQVQIHSQR